MKLAMKLVLVLGMGAAWSQEAIQLGDVGCINTVCFQPAPGVEYLSFSPSYKRVTISLNGVLYDSGAYAVAIVVAPTFDIEAIVYGPEGFRHVKATIRHWTTRTVSGRGQYYIQHYELLSGQVSP